MAVSCCKILRCRTTLIYKAYLRICVGLWSVPVGVNVGAQDGVHAGQMPFPVRFEPLDDIAVEPQMHGSLAARHDDTRLFPKRLAQGFGLGRVRARLILAARAHGFDLAK